MLKFSLDRETVHVLRVIKIDRARVSINRHSREGSATFFHKVVSTDDFKSPSPDASFSELSWLTLNSAQITVAFLNKQPVFFASNKPRREKAP